MSDVLQTVNGAISRLLGTQTTLLRVAPLLNLLATFTYWVIIIHPNYLQCFSTGTQMCYVNFTYDHDTNEFRHTSTTCDIADNLCQYFTSLYLVASWGVFIINEVVQHVLHSRVRKEDRATLSFSWLTQIVDHLCLLTLIFSVYFFDKHNFHLTNFSKLFVFYLLAAPCVNIVMHKCHIIFLEDLHNGYVIHDEVQKKRRMDELKLVLLYGAMFFFCISVWAVQFSIVFYESGQVVYFHFILRFVLLLSDLVFTLMWCLAELDAQRIVGLPGKYERLRQILIRQTNYKEIWRMFKRVCFILIIYSDIISTSPVYCFMNLMLFVLYATGKQPHSLLGYELLENLKLNGVNSGDFHDTNKDCAVCLDELVANEKGHGSIFDDDDAVKIPCGHIFHHHCLMEWMKKKKECPTCNQSVFKKFDLTQLFPETG